MSAHRKMLCPRCGSLVALVNDRFAEHFNPHLQVLCGHSGFHKDVSPCISSGPITLSQREELAQRVASAFESAFAKLEERKTDIERLWKEFETLKGGETIMGCRNKTEFCTKVLHRTPRAVQYLVYGREQCSHVRIRKDSARPTSLDLSRKQRERLLNTAAIIGTELLPAYERHGDLSAPMRELKKIAFDSAELNAVLEGSNTRESISRPDPHALTAAQRISQLGGIRGIGIDFGSDDREIIYAEIHFHDRTRIEAYGSWDRENGAVQDALRATADTLVDKLKLFGLWDGSLEDRITSAVESRCEFENLPLPTAYTHSDREAQPSKVDLNALKQANVGDTLVIFHGDSRRSREALITKITDGDYGIIAGDGRRNRDRFNYCGINRSWEYIADIKSSRVDAEPSAAQPPLTEIEISA